MIHLVTIKNFTTPVTVRLQFEDIQVLPEGASAQFAITDKGEPLAQALLDDLTANDPEEVARLSGIMGELLVGVRNTIGVDVGEGAVNYPVFVDGAFNSEAAGTLDQGLRHRVDQRVGPDEHTSGDKDLRFKNRKALANSLQQEPSIFLQGRHDRAAGYIAEEAEYLAEAIATRFEDVLAEFGGTTEVVYVYGGGSSPIKEILRPVLQKAAGSIPVLYLDAAYSRHLNREGLDLAGGRRCTDQPIGTGHEQEQEGGVSNTHTWHLLCPIAALRFGQLWLKAQLALVVAENVDIDPSGTLIGPVVAAAVRRAADEDG